MLERLAPIASSTLLTLLVAIAPWTAVAAEETRAPAAAEPQVNVRVTIRLGKLEQGKRHLLKRYDLVVAAGTVGSKLLSGARVPIPTASGDAVGKGAEGEGSTRFVYQNIGFSTEAKVWIVGDRKIKLLAEIEDSRLGERLAGQPPIVETRQLSVNAILSDGTPMDVTSVQGEADPSGYVEIEATILR